MVINSAPSDLRSDLYAYMYITYVYILFDVVSVLAVTQIILQEKYILYLKKECQVCKVIR